jgi:ankyrin repeat protein
MPVILKRVQEHLNHFDLGQTESIDYFDSKAAYLKEPIIIKIIEQGVDKHFKDFKTPIDELIKRGANINALTSSHTNALHMAINLKREDMAYYLIDSGIDLTVLFREQYNVLELCVEKKTYSTLYYLLKHGMDINSTYLDSTPILLMVLDERSPADTDAFYTLIEKGAKIDICDNNGLNALFTKQALSNAEIRNYLISQGIDYLIASKKEGNTILHYCSDYGLIDEFKFYCEKGANPYQVNNSEINGFDYFNDLNIKQEIKEWYDAFYEQKMLDITLDKELSNRTQKIKI